MRFSTTWHFLVRYSRRLEYRRRLEYFREHPNFW